MAGTLMFLSGLLTFFIGITGVIRGIFFNRVAAYPFYFSVRSRGVTLLVIGAVAAVVGLALLVRMHWARHVATVVAVVSAVANFMFLPFYPFWSIIVLILNVIVIWELTRDGESREFARLLFRARVVSGCAHPRPGFRQPCVQEPVLGAGTGEGYRILVGDGGFGVPAKAAQEVGPRRGQQVIAGEGAARLQSL